jgi:hypothetical protein
MNAVKRFLRLTAVLLLSWFSLPAPAHAGGSADSRVGVEKFGDQPIRDFALKVNDELDARKVNLAIIARSGRPRSELPKGISYTHVAFVVFEPVRGADGSTFHTYTVYNLYQGDQGRQDRSYLKQDLTYDFVAGIAEKDVAVCVPTDELQARILAVIRSPAYAALHNPDYNLLTNPWVDRFDNCVTHTLKICMAAIYRTDDRARIYADIRAYFRPTPVRLGPVKALGSHFIAGLSYDDVDRSGLQTASYDSLKAFLEENGLAKESFTVALDGSLATDGARPGRVARPGLSHSAGLPFRARGLLMSAPYERKTGLRRRWTDGCEHGAAVEGLRLRHRGGL